MTVPQWLIIGRVGKPHGVHGDVLVDIITDFPERLADGVEFGLDYEQDTWGGATPIATAPVAYGGNRPRSVPTVSGASPLLMPRDRPALLDGDLNPLERDAITGASREAPQLVHIMSSASPETRRQMGLGFGYQWDEAALRVGGGLSSENDYESRFVSLDGRWDLDRKLTSLNLGLSYTSSDVEAILDHTYVALAADGEDDA